MMYPQEKEIEEAIDKALIKDAESFRDKVNVYSNWASQIGHPCLRYLCYHRTHWKEKQIPNVDMLNIFGLGKPLESAAANKLKMAGYEIYEEPESINWKKFQISGRMDRKMKWDNKILPVEIKGLSPYTWKTIEDIDSFFISDKYYMKMYPAQLLLYCLMKDIDQGVFAILNKFTGRIKIVWLYIEPYLEFAESLLKKAEKINKYIVAYEKNNKTEPLDRINNFDICLDCGFRHICKPVLTQAKKTGKIEVPKEFEKVLEQREQLSTSHSEYNKLDRQAKKFFKENELKKDVVIGKFLIQPQLKTRKETIIPASEYYQYKISRIEE